MIKIVTTTKIAGIITLADIAAILGTSSEAGPINVNNIFV